MLYKNIGFGHAQRTDVSRRRETKDDTSGHVVVDLITDLRHEIEISRSRKLAVNSHSRVASSGDHLLGAAVGVETEVTAHEELCIGSKSKCCKSDG